MKILEHFEKITAAISNGGLSNEFFAQVKEHIEAASAFLHTSEIQTALFALLFENIGEGPISVMQLSEPLHCRKMEIIKYIDDFEILEKKRLIRAEKIYGIQSMFLRGLRDNNKNFPKYYIPIEVINAIRKDTEYEIKSYSHLNPQSFYDYADGLLDALNDNYLDFDSFEFELNSLFEQNKHISFIKAMDAYDLGIDSITVMLIFCCALIHNDDETISINTISCFLGNQKAKMFKRRFESKEHKLFVNGLIEFDCQMGIADTELYRLSQKAKDEFLADIDIKERAKLQGKNVIFAEKINPKKLYYREKIQNQIIELTELLKEDNFPKIQKRLAESGMRTGFPCLFSGPPGTGKTETVYQIAKETGRDIVLVDIAETKSMWFGESEKQIKKVFDRYRGMVKSGGLIPILLFNEADAILGKRRELSQKRSGPDQTENAIQNIILQEIENLNGILIATTNMTINLDKAFERRFLYKIEFEKPDTSSKKMIWRSLIPTLPDEDAAQLASKFDFSGGQIENISRKRTIEFVLLGTEPSLQRLITFCQDEQLNKETSNKIGFGTN